MLSSYILANSEACLQYIICTHTCWANTHSKYIKIQLQSMQFKASWLLSVQKSLSSFDNNVVWRCLPYLDERGKKYSKRITWGPGQSYPYVFFKMGRGRGGVVRGWCSKTTKIHLLWLLRPSLPLEAKQRYFPRDPPNTFLLEGLEFRATSFVFVRKYNSIYAGSRQPKKSI